MKSARSTYGVPLHVLESGLSDDRLSICALVLRCASGFIVCASSLVPNSTCPSLSAPLYMPLSICPSLSAQLYLYSPLCVQFDLVIVSRKPILRQNRTLHHKF